LAENFASAKRTDENGDLPIHLLLKCGERVDQVVVKTLLTCFSSAAARTDMNGDLPLSLAIKNRCKPSVINTILMQYPNAASTLNSSGETPLHLAFEHGCDDRTILGLLNHAPEFATLVDKKSGLLPIQVRPNMNTRTLLFIISSSVICPLNWKKRFEHSFCLITIPGIT